VVVEDVEEKEVMVTVALAVVETDVDVETVVVEETVVVPDVVNPRRRPGSPSPSLAVS
jgi:hypothetical protein